MENSNNSPRYKENKFSDYKEIISNYEELKKTYKSKPVMSKYEKTLIIGIRAQQIAGGCECLVEVPKHYTNTLDIALFELKQRKTPFIIKRNVGNNIEYWKIEDMLID